jgi:hypothetical protein
VPNAGQTVVTGPDGSDTLTNVEVLQFADVYQMIGNTADLRQFSLPGSNSILGTDGGDFLTVGINGNGHPVDLGDGLDNLFLNDAGFKTFFLDLENVEQVFGISGDGETVSMMSAVNGTLFNLGFAFDTLNLANGTNVVAAQSIELINGGSGHDTIRVIQEPGGQTQLWGRGGADTFILDAALGEQVDQFHFAALSDSPGGAGRDTIENFNAAWDIIDLRDMPGVHIDHWDVTGGVFHAYVNPGSPGVADLEIALPGLTGVFTAANVLL